MRPSPSPRSSAGPGARFKTRAPSKSLPLSFPSPPPRHGSPGSPRPSWGAPPCRGAAVPGAEPSASDLSKAMLQRGGERSGGGGGGGTRGCRAGDGDAQNLLLGLDNDSQLSRDLPKKSLLSRPKIPRPGRLGPCQRHPALQAGGRRPGGSAAPRKHSGEAGVKELTPQPTPFPCVPPLCPGAAPRLRGAFGSHRPPIISSSIPCALSRFSRVARSILIPTLTVSLFIVYFEPFSTRSLGSI